MPVKTHWELFIQAPRNPPTFIKSLQTGTCYIPAGAGPSELKKTVKPPKHTMTVKSTVKLTPKMKLKGLAIVMLDMIEVIGLQARESIRTI